MRWHAWRARLINGEQITSLTCSPDNNFFPSLLAFDPSLVQPQSDQIGRNRIPLGDSKHLATIY